MTAAFPADHHLFVGPPFGAQYAWNGRSAWGLLNEGDTQQQDPFGDRLVVSGTSLTVVASDCVGDGPWAGIARGAVLTGPDDRQWNVRELLRDELDAAFRILTLVAV